MNYITIMKMKLIKINPDHYIIVDDSEIREGDWFINETNNIEQGIGNYPYKSLSPECKKITHSTQPLEYSPKIGKYWNKVQPVSLSEIKELIGEVDVEKKSYTFIKEIGGTREQRLAYIDGYREAIEDNKHMRFTYDELLTLALRCWNTASNPMERSVNNLNKIVDEYIQRFETTQWDVEFVDGKLKLK